MISKTIGLFVVTAAVTACAAQAASIVVEPLGPDKPTLVLVEGTIVDGDAEQFQAKVNSISTAVVGFQSDGGNLLAGLAIGENIRLRNYATFVLDNGYCASACALAWLGGTKRLMGSGARIGFHAASNVASGQETGLGNALVGAYLTRIGLPYSAVIYITKAAPDSITWLNITEARQYGIDVTLLDAATPSQQANTQNRSPNPSELDRTASDFIAQVFSEWSQPNSYVSKYLSGLYGDQVLYYGEFKSRQAVLADKLQFVERWPERSYKLRPGSLSVQCDQAPLTCNVEGIVDWQARSPSRSASSSGAARFAYTLALQRKPVTIVAETSSVITRTAGTGSVAAAQSLPDGLDPHSVGQYVVHVSSQRTQSDAEASFRVLQSKFPSLLGRRRASIVRTDLDEKGIYYRVLVGQFASANEAVQLCDGLKAAGGQCLVVPRP